MYNSDEEKEELPEKVEVDGYTYYRDSDGRYVNSKRVIIEAHFDKFGKFHVNFYDKDPRGKHSGLHFNADLKENKDDHKADFNSSYYNEDKTEKEEGSGSCYLTTACMKYLKDDFDDDCYELTTLRKFRDKYVSQEDIKHYYEVAPKIVDTIDNSENKDKIYNDIYSYIIEPCIEFIENKEYQEAYDRYKISSMVLENNFLSKSKVKKLLKKK